MAPKQGFQDLGAIMTDPMGSAHKPGDDHVAERFQFSRPDMSVSLGITVLSSGSLGPPMISEVEPGSLAAGRLKPGDRIITVNDEPVKGAKAVTQLISSLRQFEILVERSTGCSKLTRQMSARSK
jgi:C-terminal processing protease CtpA/Prc